jgi:hypothetical protein
MMTIAGDPPLRVRAVTLDQPGAGIGQAVLDPRMLELEFYHRDGLRMVEAPAPTKDQTKKPRSGR